ncbi:hypothetical protein C3B79_4142 [Aeromonas hydrophila]|nr:hypothetical protein C3B79_4142 [Aeromonas hydrophila]
MIGGQLGMGDAHLASWIMDENQQITFVRNDIQFQKQDTLKKC